MRSQSFEPADLAYASRVRSSFDRQSIMSTLGAKLVAVEAGSASISMPYRADLTQQHGFLHGGIVSTLLDSALGYAAFSLMPADAEILTVEYKVNLVAPARGDSIEARGWVLKSGRTLTVCSGEAVAITNGEERLIATMQSTLMAVYDRPDIDH